MTLNYFRRSWKRLNLVNHKIDKPLTSFLKDYCGERSGGLLFYTKDGDIMVLKCDEANNCYQRTRKGFDDEGWEWIGRLVDHSSGPDLPPYT